MLWLQVLNCFKQFRILSDFHLSHFSLSTGSARPADTSKCSRQERQQWGRKGELPHTWKGTYIISKWPSPCVGLTNLFHFVIRHRSFSRLRFAPSRVAASCYLPRSCWLFHSSHHLYALVPASDPSLIPLVIPSLSRPACLISTGVVIPSPQRRLNDFILPRLSLLPLTMCLLPSDFEVDYRGPPLYVRISGKE